MFDSKGRVDAAVLVPPNAPRTDLPVGLGLAAERSDAEVSMNTDLAKAVTAWTGGEEPVSPTDGRDIAHYEFTVAGGGLFGSETEVRIWRSETEASHFDDVVDGLLENAEDDRDPATVYGSQSEEADPGRRLAVLARNVDVILGTVPASKLLNGGSQDGTSAASSEYAPDGIPAYEVLYRSTSLSIIPVLTGSRSVLQADEECSPEAVPSLRTSFPRLDRLLELTDERLHPVDLPEPGTASDDHEPRGEGFDSLLSRLRE
ncbi:hypothetical protein [Haloparvum sedimenti]|uniref:hypothetical protein n=1 Tax=Haloparvum sedimenti TaxID=1678448 RepID=UPI00071E946F|nr:hypothetical protein [Haloparvum sedimenti]